MFRFMVMIVIYRWAKKVSLIIFAISQLLANVHIISIIVIFYV